jgi:aspartyl-tRNA(Asn)/glutamyl-tRNA(Gln) amidotransferase subunit A
MPKTIKEIREKFINGNLKPSQLLEFYLKNINEKDKKENGGINAFLEVFENEARENAKKADEIFASKDMEKINLFPLLGIPVAIKDCLMIQGHTASAGSKMLENYISPYDATAVRLIKENGGIILGRTNMDEFALGGSGENSAYGKTLNPINNERVPGGTSSGSAAAVAAEMCLVALGTDTGGSVRQPASFCGVVGLKPSYGKISRYGLIAAASSLDTVGVIAHDVESVEYVLNILGKEDGMDNTSLKSEFKVVKNTNKKVAYPKKFMEEGKGINEEVRKNFFENLEKIKSLGYEVVDLGIEDFNLYLAAYYIVNTAEVSSNMSRFDGLRYGGGDVGDVKNYSELFSKNRAKFFGKEVKRRIMLGSYVLSHGYYDAFYGKATKLREVMKEEFRKILSDAPIIVMPTAPTTAFKFGEDKDPITLYMEDIFTVPANLMGFPGVSIPTGSDSEGLPFSLQILADFGQDDLILDFAKKFEKVK